MENNIISAILDSAYNTRTPLCCTLEITKKCNFDCVHCYLSDNHTIEMAYADIIDVINQIKDAGTFFLNLTGGEIMIHPEFSAIYSYAYQKGMIISLLTNASILTEDIRKLLKEMPPRKIEITIYGTNKTTFENVTRTLINPNIIFANIEKLKEDGHNILLKMIVIKENLKDFDVIKQYAKQKNIPFQYDFNILPTLQGNKKVKEHELSVDDVIDLEIADGKKNQWKIRIENYDIENNKKISCGCGKFSYAVAADLLVKKCTFMEEPKEQYFLCNRKFRDIWKEWTKEESVVFKYAECKECKYQSVCDICPSISYVLSDNRNGIVERQCELARKRYEIVQGGNNI